MASLTRIRVYTSFSDRPKRCSTARVERPKFTPTPNRTQNIQKTTQNIQKIRHHFSLSIFHFPPPCCCTLNSPPDHCTTPMENHDHDAVACFIACSLSALSLGARGPSSPTKQISVSACCSNQLRLAPAPSFIATLIPLPERSRVGSSLI